MTSIIVVGGAGKLGKAIVAEAARQGLEVTAHVRDTARAADLPKVARVVEGNGLDRASLAAAIPGHDAVVVPAGGRTEPVSADIVANAIAIMQKTGVRRLIAVSAYGAVEPHGFYGWMLQTMTPRLAADKQAMEAAMAKSGLDWTAVRPPILNDGPAKGKVEARTGAVLAGMPAMSRSDLAAFLLSEILHPAFIGASPVVFASGTRSRRG